MLIGVSLGVALLAAFGQAVSGFGFALISVPLLIPFAGASAAVAAPPILSFLTMGSSLHQRACPVAHGSVVSATPISGCRRSGLLALQLLAARWLSLVMGCTVIVMVIVARTASSGIDPLRWPAC